jgi:hypothetical protein
MLKFEQFDVKSGKSLTTYDPALDAEVTAYKEVEHSYLEHWLDRHGLKESAQLYVANFYDGVNDRDRLRLEAQDRILGNSSRGLSQQRRWGFTSTFSRNRFN